MRKKLLDAAAMVVVLSGCSSFEKDMESMDFGTFIPPVLAAGAGYAAYEASDGDPWITGGVAAGTYVVSEYIRGRVKRGYEEEFAKGYELGKANAVKQQYWITQQRQKEDVMATMRNGRTKNYTFQGVREDRDGVKYVDHDVTVSVQE